MTAPHTSFSLARLLDDLQIEGGSNRRRDSRPAWLIETTECIADLFEPLRETARVGYDCRPVDGRWQLDVFLGHVETIGGAQDGLQQVPSFRFDLRAMFRCFDRIDGCDWIAAPSGEEESESSPALPAGFSQLRVDGEVAGEPLAVTVSSLPPEEIGLGLRIFEDGDVATA